MKAIYNNNEYEVISTEETDGLKFYVLRRYQSEITVQDKYVEIVDD